MNAFEPDEKLVSEFIDKYTFKEPVVIQDEPDAHSTWLKFDHQRFRIADTQETAKQADWYRRQLAIGLSRFLENEKCQSRKSQ